MVQRDQGLLVEGFSKMQCREIYDAVDEGTVQLATRTDPTSLQVIGETALVIIAVGYPIARAIARAIARDRTTIRISRAHPDGTTETLSIDSSSAGNPESDDGLVEIILNALKA